MDAAQLIQDDASITVGVVRKKVDENKIFVS